MMDGLTLAGSGSVSGQQFRRPVPPENTTIMLADGSINSVNNTAGGGYGLYSR